MQNKKEIFNQLLKRIIAGDLQKAPAEFYAYFGRTMFAFAMTACRCTQDADEVVNDVLFKICRLTKLVQDIENPAAWLFTITVNKARDAMRFRKWPSLGDNVLDPRNRYDETDALIDFQAKIANLSPDEQVIMTLKFVGELTFDEIAAATERPLSTVTSSYYRAIIKLKNKNCVNVRKKRLL